MWVTPSTRESPRNCRILNLWLVEVSVQAVLSCNSKGNLLNWGSVVDSVGDPHIEPKAFPEDKTPAQGADSAPPSEGVDRLLLPEPLLGHRRSTADRPLERMCLRLPHQPVGGNARSKSPSKLLAEPLRSWKSLFAGWTVVSEQGASFTQIHTAKGQMNNDSIQRLLSLHQPSMPPNTQIRSRADPVTPTFRSSSRILREAKQAAQSFVQLALGSLGWGGGLWRVAFHELCAARS